MIDTNESSCEKISFLLLDIIVNIESKYRQKAPQNVIPDITAPIQFDPKINFVGIFVTIKECRTKNANIALEKAVITAIIIDIVKTKDGFCIFFVGDFK